MESSYSEGTVDAKLNWIGGLIGSCWSDVANCYSIANVNGNIYVGGLLGYLASAKNVNNCYSKCTIKGAARIGGLIGHINSTRSLDNKITNSISYSEVIGNSSSVGSLIGYINMPVSDPIYLKNVKVLSAHDKKIGSLDNTSDISQKIKEVELKNTSTNLQVGIKAESASQIDFDTNFELDLGKIVRNGIRSDSALSAIDDFIDLVSSKETELGAVSNRLESVLDEIEIQYNNLASSRSTIRDADIAEVSSEYIKMQILQQASSTLLATANQTPSIALQLI